MIEWILLTPFMIIGAITCVWIIIIIIDAILDSFDWW